MHCGARESPTVNPHLVCVCGAISYCSVQCLREDRPAHRITCTLRRAERRSAPGRDGLEVGALRRAAHTDAAALADLGICYSLGLGGAAVDHEEAFLWLSRAVAVVPPSMEAVFNLAQCHLFGRGTPKDAAEAARLFAVGAEGGSVLSQYALGVRLLLGEGVHPDHAQEAAWFCCAADAGDVCAQFAAAHVLEATDPGRAVEYYRCAARQGSAPALHALGACFAEGRGVGRDRVQAASWFRQAVEKGDPDAADALEALAGTLPAGNRAALRL